MAFVNVEIKQTPLERRIFYSRKYVNLKIEAGHFYEIEWFESEKINSKDTGVFSLPLKERGVYRGRIYFFEASDNYNGVGLSVAGPACQITKRPENWETKKLGITYYETLFRYVFDEQRNNCAFSLQSLTSPEVFNCTRICLLLEQIV